MENIKDIVAVITGGASRIGAAVAKNFAAQNGDAPRCWGALHERSLYGQTLLI